MSRAEKFINEHTRNCSNEMEIPYLYSNPKNFYPWLTPDQARNAVEVVSEEIYEWVRVNLCNYFDDTRETFDKFLDDLKQAIKDE